MPSGSAGLPSGADLRCDRLAGMSQRDSCLLPRTSERRGSQGMIGPRGLVVLKGAAAFAANCGSRGTRLRAIFCSGSTSLAAGSFGFFGDGSPSCQGVCRPRASGEDHRFRSARAQGRDAWLGYQDCIRRFDFAARAKGVSSLSRFAESDPSRDRQD